jgi:Serine hydrolase
MLEPEHPARTAAAEKFLDPYPADPEHWERLNAQYWLDHYEDFAAFFFGQCFPEPHSTKQREDCAGWAAETTPEVLLADVQTALGPEPTLEWARRVSVPTLVIHGDDDRIGPLTRARSLARATGGELVVLEGAGHIPLARDPVRINLLIRDFVDRLGAPRVRPARWTRGRDRRRRALFVSSPIGLGHARRDIAIASELRRHHLDLEIDWLAQHPVTRMLAEAGQRVHPASSRLASESAHIESESGEHRLHCFQAWRGLTTCLELTATRRPFIYLPLRQHFEQAFHVHHRLQAHRAGRRMDFGEAQPDVLAEGLVDQLTCPIDYRPVERDGATRAATAIAGLL